MSARPAPDMGRAADPALIALALRMARALGNRLPCLADEFESCALVGLAEAASTYDETLRVPFDYHAWRRIRGALNDCWRHWRPYGYKTSPDAVTPRITSLEKLRYKDESGHWHTLQDLVVEDSEPPDAGPEYQDEIRALAGRLPPRHGQVIRYLYRHAECRRMRVAGEAMGLTEARISQLHKEAIAMLREELVP